MPLNPYPKIKVAAQKLLGVRPGYLRDVGLSAADAAARRPGIVYATASLNGETGPWADHVGFDQTAGSLVEMMNLEGGHGKPKLPPILVVNDYIVSWLMAAGITEALCRRAVDGSSYRGACLADAGRAVDPFARHLRQGLRGRDRRDRRVTDQVFMSRTPGRYEPTLVPRGSSRPQWQ